MVLQGGRLSLVEFPKPAIQADQALLRVEACGICGSDVDQFRRPGQDPVIPGHEPVGVIEAIGSVAESRLGVHEGDLVAVDPMLRCGTCAFCVGGRYDLCNGRPPPRSYGHLPLSWGTGLSGGYSTHMILDGDSLVYKVPEGISADLAVLYNSLASGFKWAVTVPSTTIGTTVAVLGCGQRGLACVLAAKLAGASLIVATGLARDRHKLELALELGADHVVVVDEGQDVCRRVDELTSGMGVDVVIDSSAGATQPVLDAVTIARMGGTVVLAGLKNEPVRQFASDMIVLKGLNLIGVRSVGADSYRQALAVLSTGNYGLERLRTHDFALEDAAEAIAVLRGDRPDACAINVAIRPQGIN